MPGMDGIETTQKIREMGYTQPIIALTANAIVGQKEFFLENGFNGFISKPIDIHQLNSLLNELVRDKKPPEVVAEARLKQIEMPLPSPVNEPTVSQSFILLQKIKGLYADSALELMGGDLDALLQTTKLFARLALSTLEKTDKYLDENNIKDFTIEIHGLKGAMRNIGANAAGNKASRLESAGLDSDLLYCKEHYPPFRAEMVTLIAEINEAINFNEGEKKEAADLAPLRGMIPELRAAAEGYDCIQAIGLLKPFNGFSYGDEADKLMHEIVCALEVFDCGSALVSINALEEAIR
jgi:CheY-like chemotaxis protein